MNSWKTTTCIAALFLGGLAVSAPAQVENNHQAEVLLQEAKHRALVDGDLERAIVLCKQILAEYSSNRTVAAKALLQMGGCYEKLGKQEAQTAYQRLIKEFADQNDVANQARVRLAAMESDNGKSEMAVRKIWGAKGTKQELQDEDIALYWLTWGAGEPSPNGRYIAYTNWGPPSIGVYDLSTGESRDITDEGTWDGALPTGEECGSNPIWSPDGRYVAYQWCIYGTKVDELKDHNELRIIGLDGEKPRRVIYRTDSTEFVIPRDWSPDGKTILATIDHIKKGSKWNIDARRIVLISVEDGSRRILKTFEQDLGNENHRGDRMFVSPDGRYIAYDIKSQPDWSRDIFLLKTDGSGDSTPLLTHPADDQLLGWAPDGKRVLFATNRTGVKTMALIEVHEGQPGSVLQIRHLEPGFQPMGLTRNGAYYYSISKGTTDIYTATLDLETGKVVVPPMRIKTPMESLATTPCWSSNGQYLAYFTKSDSQGRYDTITIKSMLTREVRRIKQSERVVAIGRGGPHNLRWSPDGRSFLVFAWLHQPLTKIQGGGIFLIDAQTGEETLVAQADESTGEVCLMARWSSDGKSVFYQKGYLVRAEEGMKNRARIIKRDLASGNERDVVKDSVVITGYWVWVGFSLSPDGRWIAYLSGDPQENDPYSPVVLKVKSVAGEETKDLLHSKQCVLLIGWTPDGRHILYRPQKSNGAMDPDIWKIPATGGEPRKIELPRKSINELRLHPDTSQVAFEVERVTQELWVMENFLPDPASPRTLAGTDGLRRPFGLAFDVPDPVGDDIKEFAATVKLPGDDNDWNAPQWCGKIHPGNHGSFDGLWECRWISDIPGDGSSHDIARVKTVGDWVYILCGKGKDGLIKARRQGNRLVGGWIGVVSPGAKSRPWVGLIVNDERIDGAWTDGSARGRWDFRRNLLPSVKLTSPIKDNYVAAGEPVLLQADVGIAKDATVRRVEFLIDGVSVGHDTNPPYQFLWDRAKQGSHWAAAKVYDSAGASERSLPVNVLVGGLKRVVARSEDDAQEIVKNGSILLDTEDLNLLAGDNMVVGLRFTDIRIPRGVRVKHAHVQFTVPTDLGYRNSEKADLVLRAELAAHAEPFAKVKHNITSRPTTAASVKWSPQPWTEGERSNRQFTPDLAPLVQEVVNQPDWQEAGALVLIISGSGRRDVESWDKGGSGAPMLYIEY